MGNHLLVPSTTKETTSFSTNGLNAGISSMQGFRREMEDTHIIANMPNAPDHSLFAVFDGHGGKGAAIFAQNNFVSFLAESPEWITYLATMSASHLTLALTNCFINIDNAMRKLCDEDNTNLILRFGGCTAVVVIVTPTFIICANAGDSRAVMSKTNLRMSIPLSHDHKPQNPDEKARIEKCGGFVNNDRINNILAVSRSFGDFDLKIDPNSPLVSCLPEFEIYLRDIYQDEMIIIACDGLWDVFSNDDAITAVREMWSEGENDTCLIAEEMLDLSIQKGSTDNISAIVVKLCMSSSPAMGGGVAFRRHLRALKENEMKEKGMKESE